MKRVNGRAKQIYKTGGAVLLALAVFWFAIGWLVAKGERPLANGKYPYVVVLGAGVKGETPSLILQNRIQAAARYGKQFPETLFILSGGQGRGEAISEAEAMRRGMVEAGIAEERLVLEDQSTSTTENLTFSKRLLPASENRVSIVTSDFHLYRARKEAAQINLKTDAIPAETPLSGVLRYGMRERIAIVVKYFQ